MAELVCMARATPLYALEVVVDKPARGIGLPV
jgi:hypothetical protein